MEIEREPDPRQVALDINAELAIRMGAIEELARSASRESAEALLEIGARDDEEIAILRAAGAALGALAGSGVKISEFDLRDVRKAAYDSFCGE